MSFWYGLTFEDAANMPLAAMSEYLNRLPERLAEMKLVLSEVVCLPHMKDRDRKSALRRWMREAGVEGQARPATPGVLKLLGIGVRHVK